MKRLLWLILLLAPVASADCPRIISQSPYITHTLQWLELEDCVVGVSRYDTLDRPTTGGVMDPDGEAIAALDPELILTSDWTPPERLAEVTPDSARALTLHGFDDLDQIAANLQRIGDAAGLASTEEQVDDFETQLERRLAAIDGHGLRALLLSACSGVPYTFGPGTWLAELFDRAGFETVASQGDTHMLVGADPVDAIADELDTTRPDIVFLLEGNAGQCPTIRPAEPVPIVALEDERFLQPAPILLGALEQLAEKQHHWAHLSEDTRND